MTASPWSVGRVSNDILRLLRVVCMSTNRTTVLRPSVGGLESMLVAMGAHKGFPKPHTRGQTGLAARFATKHQMVGVRFQPSKRSRRKQPPTYPFGPTNAETRGSSSSALHAAEPGVVECSLPHHGALTAQLQMPRSRDDEFVRGPASWRCGPINNYARSYSRNLQRASPWGERLNACRAR
jgi:hypothetical protein